MENVHFKEFQPRNTFYTVLVATQVCVGFVNSRLYV